MPNSRSNSNTFLNQLSKCQEIFLMLLQELILWTPLGQKKCVLIREVPLLQRLICTQKYILLGPQKLSWLERCPYFRGWFVHRTTGTSETVLTVMSFFSLQLVRRRCFGGLRYTSRVCKVPACAESNGWLVGWLVHLVYIHVRTYSGTSLLWTPLGQEMMSSLERCPCFSFKRFHCIM